MAYVGGATNVGSFMFREESNTLVRQSLNAIQGAEPVNGDGFGIGWFVPGDPHPARYRSIEPAWNDENLREITRTLESPAWIAHVRAAIGSPVQQSNCHPFRYADTLFVHNGFIQGFAHLKREIVLAIDPELYPLIIGSTDSEHMFFLALTLGLLEDPVVALERAVGFIERLAAAADIPDPMQMTVGVLTRESLTAIRYATNSLPRTLYHSNDIDTLKRLYPDFSDLQMLPGDAHAVMSEPLGTLPGTWSEVPLATAVRVRPGEIDFSPFRPQR